MTTTNLKIGVASVLVVAGLGTPLALQRQANDRLRAENAALREQAGLAAQLSDENERLAILKVTAEELERLRGEHLELLRLRGEVGRLRQVQGEVARLEAENARLRSSPQEQDDPWKSRTEEEALARAFREMGIARMQYAKAWGLAFHLFAAENHDRMPETFEQAAKYYPKEWSSIMSGFDVKRFEILFQGSLRDIKEFNKTIIMREKEPFANYGEPGFARTYLFADGHTEIHTAPDGDFEAWEKERLVAPLSQ